LFVKRLLGGGYPVASQGQRRERDRQTTERDLLDAAWKLFERDGLLGGLNLNEVAQAAGANRASIYHYFGSRQGLLRAAMEKRLEELRPVWLEDRALPFVERRIHAFDIVAGGEPTLVKLIMLVMLEGDPPFNPLVFDLDRARDTIQQDVDAGHLPADTDVDLSHIMPLAAYFGYALLRDWAAQELDVELSDLDQRARVVFEKMLRGVVAEEGNDDGVH
jgi:AcrR family transcriptional regulator